MIVWSALQNIDKEVLPRIAYFLGRPDSGLRVGGQLLWDTLLTARMKDEACPKKPFLLAKLYQGRLDAPQRLREDHHNLWGELKLFVAREQIGVGTIDCNLAALEYWPDQADISRQLQGRIRQQLERARFRDERPVAHWMELYRIENQLYGVKGERKLDDSLAQLTEQRDLYYLIMKLQDSCELLNRAQVLHSKAAQPYLDELLATFLQHNPPWRTQPALQVWLAIYQCLLDKEADAYDYLLKQLEKLARHFAPEDTRAFYKYAQNHCIRKINAGVPGFEKRLLSLYQYLLSSGIMLHPEQGLSHTDFKNIATLGARLGANEWTRNFLEEYHPYVPEQVQETVLTYSKAVLSLEQKEWDTAIRLLHQVEMVDVYYAVSARILLGKAYYYQQDWDALDYHMKAAQLFLNRNKSISPRNRRPHLHFFKCLRKLAYLAERSVWETPTALSQRHEKLGRYIGQFDVLSQKRWLLEEWEGWRSGVRG